MTSFSKIGNSSPNDENSHFKSQTTRSVYPLTLSAWNKDRSALQRIAYVVYYFVYETLQLCWRAISAFMASLTSTKTDVTAAATHQVNELQLRQLTPQFALFATRRFAIALTATYWSQMPHTSKTPLSQEKIQAYLALHLPRESLHDQNTPPFTRYLQEDCCNQSQQLHAQGVPSLPPDSLIHDCFCQAYGFLADETQYQEMATRYLRKEDLSTFLQNQTTPDPQDLQRACLSLQEKKYKNPISL